MYAVIKTGGKQYKVAAGDKIKVEQIPADVGAEITIDQVLAVGAGDQLKVGGPLVSGATVSATVVSHGRHDKVRIFKMRRRKHYQKRQGHRQNYTEIVIAKIASELGTVTMPQTAQNGARQPEAQTGANGGGADDGSASGAEAKE
jgi:large subunit ribosomal protein L21